MAQRLMLIDDLDESEGAETITYTVNGQDYEIDLSEENATRFYDVLGPTLRKAGACSARPHQRHGEATGAEAAEAAGRTSRRSVNGLSLRAWTSAPGAASGDTSSTRTTRRTSKPTAEHPAGVRRHAPAPSSCPGSILMNELTIVGNVTADPTLRRSGNGR